MSGEIYKMGWTILLLLFLTYQPKMVMNELHHSACLVCSSEGLRPLNGYYERHSLVKCMDCGFVMMERKATSAELEKHYAQYNYGSAGFLSPSTVRSYNDLLDELEAYRLHGRILDVGCGRGWFLLEAKKRGWQVYGTEFSKRAIEIGHEQGIQMQAGALSDSMFADEYFDVILSIEVLEHIDNPKEELQRIHKFLRKGGCFYCTTPNFNSILRYYLKADYNVIEFPEHLGYFTLSTLTKLAVDVGFKRKKFKVTGVSFNRINASKEGVAADYVALNSVDENLRHQISKNMLLQWIKMAVNKVLTWTKWGMTLKGYFVKS
jgi:2-polyprenyl-3-methyl-5-hydroxy-6-metoxy-1,4-benzoquinol methylase